jgi:hypothetical protein
VALYSDQGGVPGTLIASTASHTIVPETWNSVPISVPLEANTAYWLAYNTNGASAGANNLRYDAGSAGQWSYRTQTYGTWPTSFGQEGSSATRASIYVSYVTGGASVDTTPPAVAIVSPASGAVVSGTVSVTANATDNVAVTSVQFQLDGQDLDSADTTEPFSISWNTALVGNGGHVLSAVARDAAGNSTVSANIQVTTQNGTGGTGVLGYDTIAATVDSYAANYMHAWQFVMPNQSGSATSMSVYIAAPLSSAPNNQFQLAIYTDQNGLPGSLVAASSSLTILPDSWNTAVLSATLQPNAVYWLAYNTNATSSAANNVRIDPGSTGQMQWRPQTFGTWPQLFGSPTGAAAAKASIFVSYSLP